MTGFAQCVVIKNRQRASLLISKIRASALGSKNGMTKYNFLFFFFQGELMCGDSLLSYFSCSGSGLWWWFQNWPLDGADDLEDSTGTDELSVETGSAITGQAVKIKFKKNTSNLFL